MKQSQHRTRDINLLKEKLNAGIWRAVFLGRESERHRIWDAVEQAYEGNVTKEMLKQIIFEGAK